MNHDHYNINITSAAAATALVLVALTSFVTFWIQQPEEENDEAREDQGDENDDDTTTTTTLQEYKLPLQQYFYLSWLSFSGSSSSLGPRQWWKKKWGTAAANNNKKDNQNNQNKSWKNKKRSQKSFSSYHRPRSRRRQHNRRKAKSFASSITTKILSAIWQQQESAQEKTDFPGNSENNDNDDDQGGDEASRSMTENQRNDDKSHLKLPSHLEREMMKEQRRQELIPLFTMKKQMYDNVIMQDPQGHVLCTISYKKAKWYVRKQLAVWKYQRSNNGYDDNDKGITEIPEKDDVSHSNDKQHEEKQYDCIQLLFQPKNSVVIPKNSKSNNNGRATDEKKKLTASGNDRSNSEDDICIFPNKDRQQDIYNKSIKENRCVVCGNTEQSYMRHYVIPYCYRSLLPPQFKTHLPHDVVLLCETKGTYCHTQAEQAVHKRIQQLEQELRHHNQERASFHSKNQSTTRDSTAIPFWIDSELNSIASKAQALRKWKHKLPAERITEYTKELQEFVLKKRQRPEQEQLRSTKTKPEDVELTDSILQELSEIEYKFPNPHFISGPQLVMKSLQRPRQQEQPTPSAAATKALPNSQQRQEQPTRDEEEPGVGGGKDSHEWDEEKIGAFIRSWRQYFVDTMNPKFLPTGWSVDSPVKCDNRQLS